MNRCLWDARGLHWAHKALLNGVTTLTSTRNMTNLCMYTVGPCTPSVDTGAAVRCGYRKMETAHAIDSHLTPFRIEPRWHHDMDDIQKAWVSGTDNRHTVLSVQTIRGARRPKAHIPSHRMIHCMASTGLAIFFYWLYTCKCMHRAKSEQHVSLIDTHRDRLPRVRYLEVQHQSNRTIVAV